MQIVTRSFRDMYRRFKRREHNGRQARFLKRTGHHRHRVEVRRFLAQQDWDGDVIAARPVTGWDVC